MDGDVQYVFQDAVNFDEPVVFHNIRMAIILFWKLFENINGSLVESFYGFSFFVRIYNENDSFEIQPKSQYFAWRYSKDSLRLGYTV